MQRLKISVTEYDMVSSGNRSRQSFNDNNIMSVRSSKIIHPGYTRESEKRA